MQLYKFKFLKLFLTIKLLLDLRLDFDELGAHEIIKSGSDFRSGNAWGLIFAIFIASIGLYVNSTAVIIGAMLISPLMGPIVGAGYSIGTHNFDLLKKSTTNLFYAIIISIFTSTIFFLFMPSNSAQSELLARTQPTFFDVLIAFCGGAAGIVATTRKAKGNAIPGVAIATALMPPLCTVGYSIAHLEFAFAIGALYLFAINATFILISTYLFVRLLRFHLHTDRNPIKDKIIHKAMTWASVLIISPSLFMAWYLHNKAQFENKANAFISKKFNFTNAYVVSKELNYRQNPPQIQLKLLGSPLNKESELKLEKEMTDSLGLKKIKLIIDYIGRENLEVDDLEKKFVTRNEVIRLLKIDNNKNTARYTSISASVLKIMNKTHPASIEKIYIDETKVEVLWKSKPDSKMKQTLEKLVYEALVGSPLAFTHAVTIL